jgi:hypothetical protein
MSRKLSANGSSIIVDGAGLARRGRPGLLKTAIAHFASAWLKADHH